MKKIKLFEEFNNRINEGNVTLTIHYNTDDDDLDYITGILKKAGIPAIVKAGIDSEEVEITLSKSEVKKATKALSADGFELQESVQESFYRLPKEVIGNQLYVVNQTIQSLYSGAADGNDISIKEIDRIIKNLQYVKSCVKKFDKAEEIEGTAYESVIVEGVAKQFDADFNDMVKNIKSGFGWIDPDYVQETWENISDLDFESVKSEIYKRLIKANLLWLSANDGESKGKQIKSLKEIGVKESVINEAFDVKVSLKHAKDAIGLFNDMFIKYGKRPSSDVFSFKEKDAAIDFVQMLVKNLNIPMGEIEADDNVIKNLK